MKFNRIIAAIDTTDDLADKVLAAAHSLAEKDGAALDAVSVWPMASMSASGVGGDVTASSAVAAEAVLEQHKIGRQRCHDRLAALVAKIAPNANCHILDGAPADEIAAYAKEAGADLIVTGSHQRGFWGALLQGGGSREVVQDAPCAVFVLTRRAAQAL